MKHTWLYAGRMALFAIALAGTPLGAQTTTPAARPEDVSSPEAVATALYRVISGPASRPRDWDRFRSLFLPSAQLAWVETRGGPVRLYNFSVEDFIRLVGPGYQMGEGFWEREIGSHVDRFGTIAQVFTTYETRIEGPNSPVVERGINSLQLIFHQDRWWITNLVFDTESPSNPIPPKYLNQPGG